MPARVLFVDDDQENLVVCEAHCAGEFNVLTCSTAEAALDLIAAHEVGVVVSDQRMPGTSGIELLERVRLEHPDIVRLLITAYSDMSAAVAAINRGQVRRYIKKPWEPDELKAEIRDALAVYEMSRKVRALSVRLRETERVYSLGIIAASVAHELRNPVGWVHDNVTHVREEISKLANPESLLSAEAVAARLQDLDESMGDAQAGAERIMDIVRGIEMPNRRSDSKGEVVDLDGVVSLSLKLVSGELRRTARLTYEPKVKPRVRGNQAKIGQVVLNLVVNAMQALADRPKLEREIRLTLSQLDGWALLEVGDSGSGVPAESREKVFDPFFTTKRDQGTGLGLAICQQIAAELNGSLTLADDPQLGGALFTLRLPLQVSDTTAASAEASHATQD